jgi:hypothetical protein
MKIKLSQLRRLVKEEANKQIREAGMSERRKLGYLKFEFYIDKSGELWMNSINTVTGGEGDDPADLQTAVEMVSEVIEHLENIAAW